MLIKNKIFLWKCKITAFWQKTRQNHDIHDIWLKSRFLWFPCFWDYWLSPLMSMALFVPSSACYYCLNAISATQMRCSRCNATGNAVSSTVWVKKNTPWGFLTFFPNGWEFLVQILQAFFTFLPTLDYKFLFNYLQLWWTYAILSATISTTQFTSYVQNVHHRPKRTCSDVCKSRW